MVDAEHAEPVNYTRPQREKGVNRLDPAPRQAISYQVKWCIGPRLVRPRDAPRRRTNQLSHQADYSILDLPEILQFIFYPRRDWSPPPPDASDFLVPVEEGVSISCRFYPAGVGSPCILYFHGNGEVVCEHDWIAQLYKREGISLFVADYRGYGRSDGEPTFASVTADAHPICSFFLETVRSSSPDVPLFLMGRSLGSHCAVELAFHYPEHFRGLIVESGSSSMTRLIELFGLRSERLSSLGEAISGPAPVHHPAGPDHPRRMGQLDPAGRGDQTACRHRLAEQAAGRRSRRRPQ